MATKYFCDRCEKERQIFCKIRVFEVCSERWEERDYCRECHEAFLNFHRRVEKEMKGAEDIL